MSSETKTINKFDKYKRYLLGSLLVVTIFNFILPLGINYNLVNVARAATQPTLNVTDLTNPITPKGSFSATLNFSTDPEDSSFRADLTHLESFNLFACYKAGTTPDSALTSDKCNDGNADLIDLNNGSGLGSFALLITVPSGKFQAHSGSIEVSGMHSNSITDSGFIVFGASAVEGTTVMDYSGTQPIPITVSSQAGGPNTVDITTDFNSGSSEVDSSKVFLHVVGSIIVNGKSQPGGPVDADGKRLYKWFWFLDGAAVTDAMLDPTSKSAYDFVLPIDKNKASVTIKGQAVSATETLQKEITVPIANNAQNSRQAENADPCSKSVWSAVVCVFEAFVITAVNVVRGVLIALFSILVAPVMQAMLSIDPSNPAFAGVILQGWVVIRNLMNILFILALLAMAIATLLRVGEQYNYRHLLVELILAALFINFSLVIAQGILSIAQAMQAQFLPHNDVVVGRLAAQLIGNPFVTQNSSLWNLTGELSGIVSSLFGLIFAFAALLVFGAITAFLMIRVVALWILLMVSPVAYAFFALPATHHEAQKWWKTFLQYAFFTPVMALFLNLCALISDAQRAYVQSGAVQQTFNVSSSIQNGTGPSSLGQFIANVLTNVLLIGCLFATLEVAKHFSIWGSDKIISAVEKGVEKPLHFGGHALGNALLRKKYDMTSGLARGNMLQRGLYNMLNPELRTKAFLDESHHKLEEAKSKALGAAQYLEEKRRSHGLDNKADINAQRKIEAAREAFFAENTAEQNAGQLKKLMENGGHTDEKIALLRVMMANGQFKKNISKELKDRNQSYNPDNIGAYLREFLGDDQQAQRFLAVDFTKRSQDAGHFEAANAYIATADGKFIDGAKTGADDQAVIDFMSDDTKAVLQASGVALESVSAQKVAMMNSIASMDLEKRGSVRLNVKNYAKKDGNGNVIIGADGKAEFDGADKALINLVAAGGAETARNMTSGQREAFMITKQIDQANGAYYFEKPEDAAIFKSLYQDNAQARDFMNTNFAISMGVTDLRNQNFNGTAISTGQPGQRATIEILGGSGNNTIRNGTHPINYSNPANIKVGLQGRKPDRQMVPQGQGQTTP